MRRRNEPALERTKRLERNANIAVTLAILGALGLTMWGMS
jgi:hypothetical protein